MYNVLHTRRKWKIVKTLCGCARLVLVQTDWSLPRTHIHLHQQRLNSVKCFCSDQIVRLPELGLYGSKRLTLGLGKPQDAADYGCEAEQRRYQIVAVHATVFGQHGVNFEGQERCDGQRNSVDRVGYGPGVGREQFAVDGGQQRAKAERVSDGQSADSQHAQPPVIGDVVRSAPVHVKVREYDRVEYKARSA